jgi:hypothetical protein
MLKIRKSGLLIADFGHAAGGGGAPCLGWWCTLPRVAVPLPPRGAVHTRNGGATHQAGLRAGCKFSCVFRPSDNPNLLFSSPFPLQLDPNHIQQLLCKCANTTMCLPSCVCVLTFHKCFLKD